MAQRCDICELDYWPNFTHCRDCHRTWHGHAECHCGQCCRSFGGDIAFLAHRADGVCRDPSGLKTKDGQPRFRIIERKDGYVWVQNDRRLVDALEQV